MKLYLLASLGLLALLCSLERVDCSAYDKIVSHSRIRAKKEGPNVCALQQVIGTKKKYFSTCRNWYKGAICGKKAMVLYECCPGYMKLEGMTGCPAVAPIDHVYGTLGLVKAATTQQYAALSQLRAEIEGKGSFTMFAPSNDAWEQLDKEVRAALVSNVNIELYNALHYHMVNRRLLTKDLKNDMTITSMYNDLGLHINHYSNGVVTVNCARIIHGNQVATNGVVHVIDRVISAVGNSIQEELEVNSDLSSFSAVALASGVMEKLGQPGHYTLFAPTNKAFEQLDAGYLERIMGDKAVIAALVNYHLLTSMQCSEAIMAGMQYETAEGSSVEVGCDGDSLTVNGIKMVLKKDIVTSNGVIHLIDQVLVPDSAKEVMELVGRSESMFGDMVSELGLSAAMAPETEYTLLAPLNSAFTDEVMTTDQNVLKVLLENHILKTKVSLEDLYNGQLLETVGGKLLRVFIYRTAVCIENACMVRGSRKGSNGALYLMRSLIKPAQTTIHQVLQSDGRFKVFLTLMESAGLTELLRQEGSYTVFAPTDDAFQGLSQMDMALLTSDINALRTILLYHFSNGVFINGGLEGGVTNLLKTLQGNNLQLLSVNSSIHVNSVDIPDNDLMASNGVVQVVRNFLYPADLPVGSEDLHVLLKRLIKYIKIKFVSGFSYSEIPLTFIKRTITTTTTHVERVPETKVTRVIGGGGATITKVTKVIESDPTITKVTRVFAGDPIITKVTRVLESEPVIMNMGLEDPTYQVIEMEPTITKVVVEGEPSITTVTKVIEVEPSFTKATRVIEGQPTITKVTRVIETHSSSSDGELDTDGELKKILNQGPDFSKITTIHGNPELVDAESLRITKIIQDGGKRPQGKKPPAGSKRRTRLVRRHHRPGQSPLTSQLQQTPQA